MPDRFWTWTAADGSGQVQPVLHAFGGTEEGLAALAVAEGPARWASRVAALRPELPADLSRAMLTTWNDDPWAGESYSALTVTVADGDDELIAAPLGRVHFAGEHTAGAWAGLMEGALRSGARAASEVLTHARPSGAQRYQQTWITAGADAQGIHVTSHSGQVIRLPILGTPRLPQFQHSLGSAFCWLLLICLRHPRITP